MSSALGSLAIRTLKASRGAAAYWTTSAFSTVSRRSGICAFFSEACSLLERSKKRADLAPDFGTPGEPAPVGAYQGHQFVALVDGNQIVLGRRGAARMPNAVDQQSAH